MFLLKYFVIKCYFEMMFQLEQKIRNLNIFRILTEVAFICVSNNLVFAKSIHLLYFLIQCLLLDYSQVSILKDTKIENILVFRERCPRVKDGGQSTKAVLWS